MAEKEDAIKLANVILDQPWRDPDDDLSVLARQLLRTREEADGLATQLRDLEEGRAVILPTNNSHAEAMNLISEKLLKQVPLGPEFSEVLAAGIADGSLYVKS